MADEHDKRVRGSAIPRAYEPVGGDALLVRTEADMKGLLVSNHVWDSDAGAWVKMEQPSINVNADDLTVTMGDVEKLLAHNYWLDKRFEYSGGDLIYKGLNVVHKAATSAATWYVWKHTWSSGTLTRLEGPLVGTWDGRAALAWA